MRIDEGLEYFACVIMIPRGMIQSFKSEAGEVKVDFNPDFERYKSELGDFAFAQERAYDEFRGFLRENRKLFGRSAWKEVEGLANEVIDYVLDRVREERVGHVFESACA